MLNKSVLTVATVVTLAATAAAAGARQEAERGQPLEVPVIAIEGEVVEANSPARVLVVRYFARGIRSSRAFRITKDTAFGSLDSSSELPFRPAKLKPGDHVRVRYQLHDGRAMAVTVERLQAS